jgi:SAM-dependent methyltransferase
MFNFKSLKKWTMFQYGVYLYDVCTRKRKTNKSFEQVYEMGMWGVDDNGKGTSGYGSDPKFNTSYIQFIRNFIITRNLKVIVDLGCGDWQFSNDIYKDLNVQYYGYDCVKHIITNNISKYKHVNKYHFKYIDGDHILKSIKHTNVDLLILKDVIQHWPNETIVTFLKNIRNHMNVKYVLLTNDHTSQDNENIECGGYRPLNWDKPPLNDFKVTYVFSFNTLDMKTTVMLL